MCIFFTCWHKFWEKLFYNGKKQCSHQVGRQKILCLPVFKIIKNSLTEFRTPRQGLDLYRKLISILKHCKDLPKMLSLTPSSIGMKPATCKHISFKNTTKYLQRLGILFSSLFEVLLSPGSVGFIWVVVVLTCPSWLCFSISIQTISTENSSQDVIIQTWRIKTKNF